MKRIITVVILVIMSISLLGCNKTDKEKAIQMNTFDLVEELIPVEQKDKLDFDNVIETYKIEANGLTSFFSIRLRDKKFEYTDTKVIKLHSTIVYALIPKENKKGFLDFSSIEDKEGYLPYLIDPSGVIKTRKFVESFAEKFIDTPEETNKANIDTSRLKLFKEQLKQSNKELDLDNYIIYVDNWYSDSHVELPKDIF
ncbi:hypothetical protein D3C81_10820 [compost metagenome]